MTHHSEVRPERLQAGHRGARRERDSSRCTPTTRRSRSSTASPSRAPRACCTGRGEIQTWIEDVCGRDMTHHVQHTVQDESGAAFTEACRYPDGTGVVCATVLEIDNGLVVRQIGVQAWDE